MDDRKKNSEASKREILAWASYDWANSAYATVVMAGFFPIFFREYWSAGQASTDITLHLGISTSIASVFVIAALPLLGAVADEAGWRRRFLFVFAVLGIVATFGLFWISAGAWLMAATVYVLATIGFAGSNAFYDSLLTGVAPREQYDTVSALGFALGYLGGGLLFALCVVMYSFPDAFGFDDGAQVVRVSFLLTALWWCLFSLPLMMFVREPPHIGRAGAYGTLRAGFRRLAATLRNIRELRMVALFLVAYWCYIDGVDTVVLLAVDYGKALGFETGDLILALLLVQFVGFPATIAFGFLGQRLGTKAGILIAIGVYILVLCWGATIDAAWEFYVLAASIGLVQGGIQSLSRAFYARLIPPDKAAELFGFYNMLGKFAAIVGPVMVGWTGVLTGSHRLGMLSLLVLFIAGASVLMFVEDDRKTSMRAATEGISPR